MTSNSGNFQFLIQKSIQLLPDPFLIPNESHQSQILQATDFILERISDYKTICDLEDLLISEKEQYPLALHVVVKLARSKRLISKIQDPIHVSIVFAVYKEHQRILPAQQHPHGENFLIQKARQLDWLFSGNENHRWKLIMVDDGCPEGTGRIAEEIVSKNNLKDSVEVLYLKDAINANFEPVKNLKTVNESRKGGSIQYGMWHAAQEKRNNHIIAFTDADLSTHLGQLGLLVHPIINEKKAAIGSRREKNSVVIKTGTRNTRGKLFIYLWKRMLHALTFVVDTQCGFKAFHSNIVEEIVKDNIEQQFAFDIELLLQTQLNYPNQIKNVGIAWIDSEAASTTKDLQPYLSMLKMIAKMYKKYIPQNPESDAFANFVLGLTEADWQTLVDNIPEEIATREPMVFNSFNEVDTTSFQKILTD
ncbi:MAG: glycosyltransferase [Melioribacteraceae bacterium]|nr:glycosyltransferase [Melioribacteraceae bacterium]